MTKKCEGNWLLNKNKVKKFREFVRAIYINLSFTLSESYVQNRIHNEARNMGE
jgi:hypothetical protein